MTTTVQRLLIASLLAVILAVLSHTRSDPDLWGHIRFGHDTVAARTGKFVVNPGSPKQGVDPNGLKLDNGHKPSADDLEVGTPQGVSVDQNADDDDTDFASQGSPAVQRFEQMEVHQCPPRISGERIGLQMLGS